MEQYSVFIVDSDIQLLEKLRNRVYNTSNLRLLGSATSIEEAIRKLKVLGGADLVITDIFNDPDNELISLSKLRKEKYNIKNIIEGSNLDDDGDYSLELQAVKELNIKSPRREIGFTKDEIRMLSQKLWLNTADKQSFVCLSSRFVYGEEITEEKLNMVDKAEQMLLDLNFK